MRRVSWTVVWTLAMAAGAPPPAAWFTTSPVPPSCAGVRGLVDQFMQRHAGRRIVLVSSGGTTVPLERNTVRFIDNFSTGSRGSKSVECFLEADYAVIFLHRTGSMEPFSELKALLTRDILSSHATQRVEGGFTSVSRGSREELAAADRLKRIYETCVERDERLLRLPFTSVFEYLHSLKAACEGMHPAGSRAMIYLAAAVSDYFVPDQEMAEHKIQSSSGDLALTLRPTPKCLSLLKHNWCPQALIVSFKLETDTEILIDKATGAILKYGVDCVIANLLQTRNTEVQVIVRTARTETIQAIRAFEPIPGGDFAKLKVSVHERGDVPQIERPLVETMARIHEGFAANTG